MTKKLQEEIKKEQSSLESIAYKLGQKSSAYIAKMVQKIANFQRKECPMCFEYVKIRAKICKHCGHKF
tara:strand:- start:462 stop:665 length:204 start_codon:yes stop_codon:yes gene_type:complete